MPYVSSVHVFEALEVCMRQVAKKMGADVEAKEKKKEKKDI